MPQPVESLVLQWRAATTAAPTATYTRHDSCSDAKAMDAPIFEQLLRLDQVVVRHHRYHQQAVDAHEVVERVLATYDPGRPGIAHQYRGLLQEAVRSLIHGIR